MTGPGPPVDALAVEHVAVEALPREDRELLSAAADVAQRAYSPYSRVRVGAAVRAPDGRAWPGCNVENASYGLTICAERSACVQAVAAGARELEAVAIWSEPSALMPCGACRQFLAEFGPELRVLVGGAGSDAVSVASLSELLPESFGPRDLG